LLLVSRSGFTDAAVAKTRTVGVETCTIEDALGFEWSAVVGKLQIILVESLEAWTELHIYADGAEGAPARISLGSLIVSACGQFRATARALCAAVVSSPGIRAATYGDLGVSDGGWVVFFPMRPGTYVLGEQGERTTVRGAEVKFVGRTRRTKVGLNAFRFREHAVAHGEAQDPELGTVWVTVVESKDAPASAGLNIKHPDGTRESQSMPHRSEEAASEEVMAALLGSGDPPWGRLQGGQSPS
jgi:hypothetical protein